MTRKNLRLLSYIRVSDVRGREGPGFISPDEQRAKCRAYAEAYGHQILEEGIELDRSGGDKTRPVFADFIERIERGDADGMIVAKLDRFARSNALAFNSIEQIEAADGVLISVAEQLDTSGYAGKFMRAIFFATAEMERNRIGEQWNSAQTSAVGRGIHVSRHVPPGYERLPRSVDSALDRKLVPDRKHGKTVTEAFAMAAHGENYSSVAAFLTSKELPTGDKGAIVWEGHRIRRLLANRVYLGEARYGTIVNPAAHEPLVNELTWNLAQRTPTGPTISNQKTRMMLAGICRCAECSYAMRSQPARGASIAVYRCRTTSPSGRCPHPTTVSEAKLEEYVLKQFLARVADVTLQQVDNEDEATTAGLAAVEAERLYRETLTNTDLAAQLGAADYALTLASLKDRWQQALASVPVPSRPTQAAEIDVPTLVAELQRRDDTQSLRELLASAIQAVFVRPAASRARNLPIEDRVHIVWNEDSPLTLPTRGERFEPRAYTWS